MHVQDHGPVIDVKKLIQVYVGMNTKKKWHLVSLLLNAKNFKGKGPNNFSNTKNSHQLRKTGLTKFWPNKSLEDAKKKCDELGANDCGSIILTNQGQLRLSFKLMLTHLRIPSIRFFDCFDYGTYPEIAQKVIEGANITCLTMYEILRLLKIRTV